MKLSKSQLRNIIKEVICTQNDNETLSEGMQYHLSYNVGVDKNIYRPGSKKFFELFQETRRLINVGVYSPNTEELELLETDIGKYGVYEGERVPLDWPMLYDDINEAKYKDRKVDLNKPKRGKDGRAYVYVRNPKTGKVIKVNFGSSMPDAMGDSDKHKKRRKSFGARHNCADKKDKTKPGYWSCRATKFFGRNIPGWW